MSLRRTQTERLSIGLAPGGFDMEILAPSCKSDDANGWRFEQSLMAPRGPRRAADSRLLSASRHRHATGMRKATRSEQSARSRGKEPTTCCGPSEDQPRPGVPRRNVCVALGRRRKATRLWFARAKDCGWLVLA